MKGMLNAFYTKPLVLYLAVMLIFLSTVAGPAEAMFVPSASQQPIAAHDFSDSRAADMNKIQTALESKIIQQKLKDYGLSSEETMVRLNKLSNEQIHQLATHTDALQPGGDPADVAFILLVLLLVDIIVWVIAATFAD